MIELLWNDPISENKMGKYINSLELEPHQRVLDVGCGAGEILIRLAERYQITGVGIDTSSDHIAEANKRAKGRVTPSSLTFTISDAQTFQVAPESFDLVICMGASHAFRLGKDAYQNALSQMLPMVVPGGFLLIAEGYMRQPASPEYRKFLGDSTPDEMTHAANVAAGKMLGLIPFAAWTSSKEEWDDFEWTYQRFIERKALADPENPGVVQKRNQRREWMDAYLEWGRDTLGYGVYLFKTCNELESVQS
ncbi:SAM-dependent methyltransferase [Gimesia aquarii]|uniref:Demethylrebeccamycin-D-glucose O-methyltransferase n=1 Tax=Gimesia aquarii TaxID=2527964 RepID=A0A517VU18_9PLAN|nr:class I SAM-dependent methyltransferase [Gimesia aquarii]QDT96501.1 Demethylrebeccamycin-D-glucose O-methyltransferase [Gimesia aquarii]